MGIKNYFKKQYEEQKKEWAERRAFAVKLKDAKQKAYRESLLKEKVKASQEVAKVETATKLKRWKEQMGYTTQTPSQPTPSVKKIVKKIKGKKRKGKRKKILKKIIKTKTPTTSKPKENYGFYSNITRGLPT